MADNTISPIEVFLRSLASGATFDTANNIAAAGDATIPMDNGAWRAPNWRERYARNLRMQQQRDALAQSQHGTAWQLGNLGGMIANPVYKYLPSAADSLGISSNMPLLMMEGLTGKIPERAKDGAFGPQGLLSKFGGY